jgi:hypothetical protein
MEAATYFEEQQLFDKAIILYEKLGNIPKAISICLASEDLENLSLLGEKGWKYFLWRLN